MVKRRIINISIILTLLFSFSAASIPYQNQELRLKARIFRVPRIQTVTWGVRAPKGGIIGYTKGGDVTADFPDGIVLLETDLDKAEAELIKAIKERVKFACSDLVNILLMKNMVFIINPESYKTSLAKEEANPQKPPKTEYSLSVLPVSIGSQEVVLKLEFIAQNASSAPDQEDGEKTKRKLLDQILGIKYEKALLVGFPSNDYGSRGTVYWLALSIEK